METKVNEKTTEEVVSEEPQQIVNKVVRNHVLMAMGIGLVPLPILDYAALTGVQLNMLRRLAKEYDIPFLEDKVKHIISPLIGAAAPGILGVPLAMSLVKFVPILGSAVGVAAMPVACGASTYALGKIFNQHFASGGTFLTFNSEKVKAHYAEMFEEGKKVATEMKS